MNWDSITHLLEDFTPLSIVIRLVLATVCGGVIGLEREYKRHSAGFRTFTLVCLGAALTTIVNIYIFNVTGSADVGRIPAGVVSGVGFLGVGSIIVTRRNTIKGITTAAGLWATACLGIAFGSGMIWASFLAFVLIMIVIGVLSKISWYVASHNRIIHLYIEYRNRSDLELLHKWLDESGYILVSMEKHIEGKSKESEFSATLEIDLGASRKHVDVMAEIVKQEWIEYVEEL